VFGSIARGKERGDSDVDLLVIGDLGLRDVARALQGVTEKIGREVNPHVLSPREGGGLAA
jgi:predicted nucleotidyltransferase